MIDKKDPKKAKAAPKKKKTAAKTKDAVSSSEKEEKKKTKEAAISRIRIKLKAFDYHVLDEAVAKIVETAERSGAVIHGPLPLPTILKKFTVNKSTFVHKNSRDQYEMRIHRRLVDLTDTTFKTVESLQNLSLPSGVDIEVQMH